MPEGIVWTEVTDPMCAPVWRFRPHGSDTLYIRDQMARASQTVRVTAALEAPDSAGYEQENVHACVLYLKTNDQSI